MRYLDNRPDEQERKITMKASNISLYYHSSNDQEYLINLIDSPGHVDFSSETSAAARLADGAIVVVDVVEGVCAQTRTILQQAYNENLKPVLLLNKIDRLIQERDMSTSDAEEHLRRVVEQVNAVVGNIFATQVFQAEDISKGTNQESALEAADDSTLYFNPTEGNVIFGSAQDGWVS
jgi:ribosome assembly protein 1